MDKLPRRKNIRLKNYDYSRAGYYFITICTKDRQKLFGEIVGVDDPVCPQPNHIHGIVVIYEGGQGRPPLPKIIQGYKSVSTRMCFKYNIKIIWQRNYYDRIIRNRQEYEEICIYIENNPLKWVEDKYYI